MNSNIAVYYLLLILVLMIGGLGVGTLIAGRLSRNREAAEQDWDATHTTD